MLGRDGQLRGRPGRGGTANAHSPTIAVSVDGGLFRPLELAASVLRAPHDVQSFASTFLLFPFSCSCQLPPRPIPSHPCRPRPPIQTTKAPIHPPLEVPAFRFTLPLPPSFSHPFDEKYTKQIKKARLLRFPSVFTTPACLFPSLPPRTSHPTAPSALSPRPYHACDALLRCRSSSFSLRLPSLSLPRSLLLVNRKEQ